MDWPVSIDAAADISNGPEDLFLEELVRKWKWDAAQRANHGQQRHPQLSEEVRLAEEDDDEQPQERTRYEPRIDGQHGHKNFAYRPHEAGFRNHHPSELDEDMEIVNPLIQSGRSPSVWPRMK